jgi:hypothetical protein
MKNWKAVAAFKKWKGKKQRAFYYNFFANTKMI